MKNRPFHFRPYLLATGSVILLLAVTFALGEVLTRWAAQHRLIYILEMAKYAKELKTPDPEGRVTHVHRANGKAHLMGVDISLNSFGQRSPEPSMIKEEGLKRIWILGSSVTLGWGVPYEKVFSTVVQNRLNSEETSHGIHFELLNAGIGNYNTRAQHLLFEKQFASIRPDMVILHYFVSDAEPRFIGRSNYFLRNSYFADLIYYRFYLLFTQMGLRKSLKEYYSELYKDESSAWQETCLSITRMRDELRKNKIPFLIVINPDFTDLRSTSQFKEMYGKIETTFSSMGIPTINSFAAFQGFGGHEVDLWVSKDDPHPNEAGHRLMADVLYNYLHSFPW